MRLIKGLVSALVVAASFITAPAARAGFECRDTPWGTRECTTDRGDTYEGRETPWGTYEWNGPGGSSMECRQTPWGTTECD